MYKKVSVVILLVLLAFSVSFGALVTVDKTITESASQGSLINTTIRITPEKAQENFDFVEFIPQDWQISSWDVSGYGKSSIFYEERAQYYYQGKMRGVAHWRFELGISKEVILTYSIPARTIGSQEFISVWLYPSGFSSKTNLVTVLPSAGIIICGNGVCEPGETKANCQTDCGPATFCGNGICEVGENFLSCSPDCKLPTGYLDGILLSILILVLIIVGIHAYKKYGKLIPSVKVAPKEVVQDITEFIKGAPVRRRPETLPEAPPAPRETYKEDEVVKRLKKIVKRLKRGKGGRK